MNTYKINWRFNHETNWRQITVKDKSKQKALLIAIDMVGGAVDKIFNVEELTQ